MLADLRDELKLTQIAFAAKLSVSQGTVSRWMNGIRPDPEYADRIEQLYNSVFGEHDPQPTTVVPVMGKIGAGAEILPEFEQIPPEGLFEIELETIVDADAVAFVVEGLSMYPRYDEGDVVICGRAIMSAMDVVGQEAAVRTADGRRFLKKIRAGSETGLFDLESHNSPPIRDVELEWAASIDLIVPAAKWRKLDRAAQKRLVERTRPKR